MNINSSSISVFPCANRGQEYDLYSRLTSEYNLTNIINQLVDTDGFVISYEINGKGTLSFNIHGYFFNVTDVNSIINGLTTEATTEDTTVENIYGVITLRTVSNWTELGKVGAEIVDEDSSFTGIDFVASKPVDVSANTYYLHLLAKNGETWEVPQESKVKFRTEGNSHSLIIDDGELT